jgi:hypothetical protein
MHIYACVHICIHKYIYMYILCIYRSAHGKYISSKDENFIKIYQASSKADPLSLSRVASKHSGLDISCSLNSWSRYIYSPNA